MREAYKQATAAVPSDRVRLEHFGAAAAPADTGPAGEFTVVLAKSGGEFLVEEGMTILETLLQNGISQNYRSEGHTSELQSLMRISYAVLRLKKKNTSPT